MPETETPTVPATMSLSRYWLGPLAAELPTMDPNSPEFIRAMADVKRSVTDFVRITTGENTRVVLSSGKQSRTESDQIILAVENDPARIDIMVGKALREASRMAYSRKTKFADSLPIFNTIRRLRDDPYVMCYPLLDKHIRRLNHSPKDVANELIDIINLLDTFRLDRIMHREAVGYTGYYKALIDAFWNTREIETLLLAPESQVPTFPNYKLHITNVAHYAAFGSALPGLYEIHDLIKIEDIDRFNSTGDDSRWMNWWNELQHGFVNVDKMPDMISTAVRILEIVYESAKRVSNDPADEDDDMVIFIGPNPDPSDEGNHDPFTEKQEQVLKMIHNYLSGSYDEGEGSGGGVVGIGDTALSLINLSGEAESETIQVGAGEFQCHIVVYRSLTPALMVTPSFPYADKYAGSLRSVDASAKAVDVGASLGAVVANRLQILGEARPIRFSRQKQGKLDKRRLAGLGYGADDVFTREYVAELNPVNLHVTVDASSSMNDPIDKWREALTFAATMAYASTVIDKLRVSVSLRSGGMDGFPVVAYIFDSKVNDYGHVRSFWPHLQPFGNTPEGLVFGQIHKDMVMADPTVRTFMVNLSDGMPQMYMTRLDGTTGGYSGESAWDHTAKVVRTIEAAGVSFLSYFITTRGSTMGKEAFQRMYGPSAVFVNPNEVTDITQTLNRLFLAD